MHDGFSLISRNSETFFVDVPQLEMAGLPGRLHNLVWILGNKHIFPKLVVFQYLSSFCIIFPFSFQIFKDVITCFAKILQDFSFWISIPVKVLTVFLPQQYNPQGPHNYKPPHPPPKKKKRIWHLSISIKNKNPILMYTHSYSYCALGNFSLGLFYVVYALGHFSFCLFYSLRFGTLL